MSPWPQGSAPARPMDVAVLHERAQRWLNEVARPAVLGGGMLERARATALALLGFTAAVGLAIAALAANQDWPLIAGSSIPTIPPRHAAVGPGVAVAGSEPPADRAEAAPSGDRDSGAARGSAGRSGGASPATPGPAPSSRLVVAPSAPTPPQGERSHEPPKPAPKPATQPSQPTASGPAPTPAPAAEPAPPVATNSEAPPEEPESNVPSWSHGHGHAYGRGGDEEDDD